MKQITLAILALAATVTLAPALAQEQGSAGKPATAQPYTPGLGEIMSLQQMRHSKLWFAGRAGNWDLADYEVDELRRGSRTSR
jgi:hypothetical protein